MHWFYELQEQLTVEELLREEWGLGKKIVHELRMAKGIIQDEAPVADWKATLPKGTILRFDWPDSDSPYTADANTSITVLFEDEHFLIARKPQGMNTHPNEPGETGTFINAVIGYLAENGHSYGEHIHRLDQGTSGLVIVAKHPAAKNIADRMLEKKLISRNYEAIVNGSVRPAEGVIDEPIGNDRHHATRRRVSPNGQAAVTHYRTIRKENNGNTRLHLTLETGRTHQIRVHLAHIGNPIVGDELYGAEPVMDGTYALHAYRVSFVHPFTHEKVLVEDPIQL